MLRPRHPHLLPARTSQLRQQPPLSRQKMAQILIPAIIDRLK
jgi:hypothetical protein